MLALKNVNPLGCHIEFSELPKGDKVASVKTFSVHRKSRFTKMLPAIRQNYKFGFLQDVYITFRKPDDFKMASKMANLIFIFLEVIAFIDASKVQTFRYEETFDGNTNFQVDCSIRSKVGIKDG